MGDCDRYSKYISDYIEGNLDHSTKKEFEDVLSRDSELREMTEKVKKVPLILNKAQKYRCSDDFSVKLRQRIHTSPNTQKIPASAIKKYSFAFSFVVIVVIASFVFINSQQSDEFPALPESTELDGIKTDPVPMAKPAQASSDTEVDIKTIDGSKVAADSTIELKKQEKESKLRYVDDKK